MKVISDSKSFWSYLFATYVAWQISGRPMFKDNYPQFTAKVKV